MALKAPDCATFDPNSAYESAFCRHIELTGEDPDAVLAEGEEIRAYGYSGGLAGWRKLKEKVARREAQRAGGDADGGSAWLFPLALAGLAGVGIYALSKGGR